jgi:hypothetical protein
MCETPHRPLAVRGNAHLAVKGPLERSASFEYFRSECKVSGSGHLDLAGFP